MDENRALKDKIQSLRAHLEEAEELECSIISKVGPERELSKTFRESLNSINLTIHSILDFDEIMKKIVSEAARAIGSETAAIFLKKGTRWVLSYSHGFPEDMIGLGMNDEEEPHIALATKTKKPVAINDAFNDERVNRDYMRKWNVRSALVVPLITRDEVIGVIFFNFHKSTFAFSDVHISFGTQLASSISLTLENFRLIENLKIELVKHKQAEEALRESEAKYRQIVETSQEGIWLTDNSNRTVFVNQKVSEMLGYSIEEILGRSPQKFISPEFSTGMEDRLREYMPEVNRLEVNRLEVNRLEVNRLIDYRFTRKDGSDLWCILSFSPLFDDQGKYAGSLIMIMDITDCKRTEKALKKAYNSLEEKIKERTAELKIAYSSLKENERSLAEAQELAHIGNWCRNIETGEVRWSDEVYRIFGFKPQEFGVTYDMFLSRVHPDEREYLVEVVKQALDKKFFDAEYRIIRPDGVERILHEDIKVICDNENTPIRLNGTVQDITERKKAEEALIKLEKTRIKEIHHRIKNNLQVISSLLDLQADKFKDESVRKAFSESQNRVFSMSLIHEELYKGDEACSLDFSSYLEKLAENLFRTYSTSGKSIHLNTDLEENTFLDMDTAVPLGIIVNELISNSLKHAFTEKKEGEIQVRFFRDKEKCNEMHSLIFSLIISDNGIGIPEDLDLENIKSLGLQLVNILVDQLDGELQLKRDNGTNFTLKFSVKEKANQACQQPYINSLNKK
ncbi:Sensory transduction histidine kinase [Methanosarcina barkeri str. Wiesmoor]|uniref:Sensory transduction histidine kinase n=2 Tax=Methanosarcina barkeri TaxID=2208 RepID=A0A0E3QK41_METBA|nr:Sensory transduction histidine kinase [Methanosarcina barkeri str. Wiesmoor]